MKMSQTLAEEKIMERVRTGAFNIEIPEVVWFWLKSGVFLTFSAAILFVSLAASYPPVHDTLHNFRHALAIVPCH